MVRLSTDADITMLVSSMLILKQVTGWRDEQLSGYTHDTVEAFIHKRLLDSCSVCYVWQADPALPTAFCGAYLTRMFHPPYVPIMYEWGWGGPKRQAVSCWQACRIWGKKNGAVYAVRSTTYGKVHPRRIECHVMWEKL